MYPFEQFYLRSIVMEKEHHNKNKATVLSLKPFIFVAAILSFWAATSDAREAVCRDDERQALLELKQNLTDASGRLASWSDEGGNCCNWSGVVCDNSTGHVLELHLRNPNNPNDDLLVPGKAYETAMLAGELSPALLDLKYLNHLDLSGNSFEGPVPEFLASFKSLRFLNLSAAGFMGLIPPQLGNLSSIRTLDLHGYDFQYLYAENLQWLSGLKLLQYLDMSTTNLSSALDWLQVTNALPSLVELRFSNCLLENLPNQFGVNFSSLSSFDLSYNGFSNPLVPRWIFSLNSLKSLDLGYNNFRGPLSEGLKNMTSLKYLSFEGNQLNGSLPDWLYSSSRIEYLNLRSNPLEGVIPEAITNLTSLASLDFAYTRLEGPIPRALGNLCRLKQLYLLGVNLSQDVSEVLDTLSAGCLPRSLEVLYLSRSQLSGHLTHKLGLFQRLTDLYLPRNSISGPIPESIGSLAPLRSLDISGNRLNGTFPEWLGKLPRLNVLWISDNLLEGVVSELHFANVTSLNLLQANGNALTLKVSPDWNPPFRLGLLALSSWNLGPKFPQWLRYQQDYVYLDLSQAGIADTIPDWFWNLSSQFFYLNISRNQLQGKLPETLNDSPPLNYPLYIDLSSNLLSGQLPCISSKADTLDLSNNSFSGSISHFLCCKVEELKSLTNLHLADNLLSGRIPDCWMSWPSLVSVDLKNNRLSGSIPSSMGSLTSLQSLHLRKNALSGLLPVSLQNLTSLLALDIGENRFMGSIPSWIGETLSNIMIISLCSNRFRGQIPDALCSLSYLTILDLAHNNLTGTIPICFINFTAMSTERNSSKPISYNFGHFGMSLETELLVIKGILLEYSTTLRLVTAIDLSDNHLSGEIPQEITSLLSLFALNLSSNGLTGRIPQEMGSMEVLESLDLSYNQLTGEIPSSLSRLTFLSYLNLSHNSLTGRIPTSTQLQSFHASSFIGNSLCGPPFTAHCSTDSLGPSSRNEMGDGDEDEDGVMDWFWFYVSAGVGFVAGFWSLVGPLLLKKSWRSAYFKMLERALQRLKSFPNNRT